MTTGIFTEKLVLENGEDEREKLRMGEWEKKV
jgi:hypothetical protein